MLLCETPLRPPNVELLDADIQNCGRERLKRRLRGLKDNLGIDLLPKPSLARLTEVLATFDGEQLLEYTIPRNVCSTPHGRNDSRVTGQVQ